MEPVGPIFTSFLLTEECKRTCATAGVGVPQISRQYDNARLPVLNISGFNLNTIAESHSKRASLLGLPSDPALIASWNAAGTAGYRITVPNMIRDEPSMQ
jgi:hypothetical protein